MASLIVRNVDSSIVAALKMRASQNGVSAEAEHRRILEEVLAKPQKKSFTEVLLSIPSVGEDSDFARVEDDSCDRHVFD
mgnify:CR=1 FL=1